MDKAEITKYKDNLLTNLRFLGEYDEARGLRKKVLLVEGVTDQKFFGHIKSSDTRCVAVADFMRARNAFSTSRTSEISLYNSKTVITTILKHIAFFPEYYDFPKGAEKWPLYGLVDNDFEDSSAYARITKLFFTDTHDLETLMLSTDKELLTRLERCNITVNEVKTALYIANQMAEFRLAIRKHKPLNPALISSPDGTIDFAAFSEGNKIILSRLLDYINSKMDQPLSREKMKRIRDVIVKDMKKKIDKEGCWKKQLEAFVIKEDSEFWMDINGHDILSAICYINPTVREVFANRSGYKQNREFEITLTESYDYSCFNKTKLYAKLQNAGLVKE